MVRPNIDLNHSVAGGVRDIEEQYDLSRTEAYTIILRLGLREIGHEDFQAVEIDVGRDPDADRKTESEPETEDHNANANANANPDTGADTDANADADGTHQEQD